MRPIAPSVRPWPVPTLRVPDEVVEVDVVGVVDVGEPAGAPYPLRIPFEEVV
ncbi:hypothetical protein [Bradyrhizobium sp. Ec3.3]|uniref:hypothetical protein n=1 Tax=Bradyrhizobium sp. Ec3.3 TaxID=189753 RepID=UPI000407102F|nr:hypothetical protein [Bradyrhizobium sp. Ec3.3]